MKSLLALALTLLVTTAYAIEITSLLRGDYMGEWKNGVKHGKGVMTYTDGSIYKGQWVDGHREGDGTYTYPAKIVVSTICTREPL
jgi:hypothetical protein